MQIGEIRKLTVTVPLTLRYTDSNGGWFKVVIQFNLDYVWTYTMSTSTSDRIMWGWGNSEDADTDTTGAIPDHTLIEANV